ncbi:MAG: diguanylate cyclase domain-containing protein, partial [Mycobacteriales bacterium]
MTNAEAGEDPGSEAGAGGEAAFAGRYALHTLLKEGNGVKTYAAVDSVDDAPVVVKVIDPAYVNAAARWRFIHETRVLAAMSGLGDSRLRDAGQVDGRLFLVQPYVGGQTLEQLLKDGRLDRAAALRVALGVASALDTAHSMGICHRDVKPANIVVDGGRLATSVTLIDFGFARSAWLDESIRDDLVGTIRYLAPESAGAVRSGPDERSDLYALGVVLYECLTGRPPFSGATIGELLRQHLSGVTPSVADAGVAVPSALEAVVQRLLCKDPADRYQSAAAVVADLTELLAAERAGTEPNLVVGRYDRRRTLTDPAFVGREAEMKALGAFIDRVATGGGGLTLLEADSGGGKSRLLSELIQQARSTGMAILRGHAIAEGGQRPFTLLHGVAEDLVRLFADDESGRRELVAELATSAPALVGALPVLAELFGSPSGNAETTPEQFGERRSLAALGHLLVSVANAARPVLLVLDDCQWSDAFTVQLLSSLFASAGPPHLGVIAAFRSEDVPEGHPLRQIPGASCVRLGPLSERAVGQLAESMAGQLPAEAHQAVIRLAEGNPFMATSVLRGLVESGALVASSSGWTVVDSALAGTHTAGRSAALLVKRLELLSQDAIDLLAAGAVIGKEFDVDLAVRLAGEPATAASIIEGARRRRLLWVDERTGRCSFFHDKIREALLGRLTAEVRRELHAAVAAEFASQPDPAPFELSYHYDAAGQHELALPHALAAAELAREKRALDTAVLHYRIAERGLAFAPLPTRIRVAEGLGDVLTLQGHYREAGRQFEQAKAMVSDPLHGAALDAKLGDLAFKQGDMPTAQRHLEGALAELGRPVPHRSVILLARLVWELVIQAVHTLAPKAVRRRSPDGAEVDFLAMRFQSRLAYVYWFQSGKLPCAWIHLREMNLAERYPPSGELAQAYSEHAPVMTMIPWYRRGVAYAQKSHDLRRDLGDLWGQGQSLSFAAVVLYAAGRWQEAQRACEAAIDYLSRTGDQWEMNTAGWHRALCLFRQGELAQAATVAQEVYQAAGLIGDQTSVGIALSIQARSCPSTLDRSLIDAQLAKESEDAHTGCELLLASALCHLRDGALDEAASAMDAAQALARRAGLRNEYIANLAPWRATVLRKLAEVAPAHNPHLRQTRIRQAAKATRQARIAAASYPNNRPHALREAALVNSLRGRGRRAKYLLERSLRVAEEQGAAYEAALTRLATAELDLATGSPRQPYDDAVAAVAAFQAPGSADVSVATYSASSETLSLFDRFTTLLTVGRAITAATTAAAVDEAIRHAGLTLLRAERCHLIAVARLSAQEVTTRSDEQVGAVSRTVLLRAVEAGAPIAAAPEVDENESLLLSEARSILAAPIFVHGEIVSCLYVTHGQVSGLFADQELQLAGFITTLAGAAYEHVAGSEARFRSLAQNSSDVITLIDADGVISYQSAAAVRVFGMPGQSMLGQSVLDWTHPEDRDQLAETLAAVGAKQVVRVDCRLRHADGSYVPVEAAISNLLEEPTVGAVVLNVRDVTERRRLEDQLRVRALHDALTGLPNRALFYDRTRQSLERIRRGPKQLPLCVAFLDLDDFKAVNDTLGHATGDELLCAVAARLTDSCRATDTVTRLGGDEFAVLFENTDLRTAESVVERMLDAFSRPFNIGGTSIVIRASIGLTSDSSGEIDPDQLLAHADAAMYAAKAKGRHGYELFAPRMQVASESRLAIRNEIEGALAQDQFQLRYQPIIDLGTDAVFSVEAKLYWDHPQRGVIASHHFIETAETSGQIVALGSW